MSLSNHKSIADITPNLFDKYAWFVDLSHEDFYSCRMDKILSHTRNQGCVVIEISIYNDFSRICDQFRMIISQSSSAQLFLVVFYYDMHTNHTLLQNVAGYVRCCHMCTYITGDIDIDATYIYPDEIKNRIGNLTLKFGKVDTYDSSLNSGSISNSLRYNVLSLSRSSLKYTDPVYYVGWHLLSLVYSLRLGLDMIIYEVAEFRNPFQPFRQHDVSPGNVCSIGTSGGARSGYNSPNTAVKLSALASWALLHYDNVIIIGGYPGHEVTSFANYIKKHNKRVILIDPQFNDHDRNDHAVIVQGVWQFNDGVFENLNRLGILLSAQGKTLILDDSWTNERKWEFLKMKISGLKPMKQFDVLLKFNWYNDSRECMITLPNFSDFIILPGMNSSNETRVLMQNESPSYTIHRNNYLNFTSSWRKLGQSKQCFQFGYYFLDSVLVLRDVLLDDTIRSGMVISLYALGNLSTNMHLSTLRKWDSMGVKYFVNLYTNVNSVYSSDTITHSDVISYRGYRDRIYDYVDIMRICQDTGSYTLTLSKLYNSLHVAGAPRMGFVMSGHLSEITNTVREMYDRLLITNMDMPFEMIFQSSNFSFAYVLKKITIFLRINREISLSTTYHERYQLFKSIYSDIECEFMPDQNAVRISGRELRSRIVRVFGGRRVVTMSKHFCELKENKFIIEISGHLLNLVLMEMIEPGNLLLWIKQIFHYYRTYNRTKRSEMKHAWLHGFFIEVSEDRLLKKWHTKLEMLIACTICSQYWTKFLHLTCDTSRKVEDISLALFDMIDERL